MWAGKAKAVEALQAPSMASLCPDLENSIDFETAQNVFIEGDNLEVLKLLQKSYNDKIKMIYIDPPYNTGKDFVYSDDFSDSLKQYLEVTNQIDGEGNRLVANSDVSGRKHSNWITMMYPRLTLARNLLTDDGVIFISIDDNEISNLRLLMDEIFGPENFVSELIWKSKSGGANDSKYFAVDHEYILCYCRNSLVFQLGLDPEANVSTSYPFEDEVGQYGLERLDKQNLRYSKSLDFEIVGPDGLTYGLTHKDPKKPNATWRWSRQRVENEMSSLVFRDGNVYTKNYKKYGSIPRSLLVDERFGRTRTGSSELRELLGGTYFDNPKTVRLLGFLTSISTEKGDIVLDFFAGSGTTGHAVALQNERDGGTRKFILVNAPEATDEKSTARAEGFEKVSEITRLRLQKVIETVPSAGKSGLRCFSLSGSSFVTAGELVEGGLPLLNETTLRKDAKNDEIASEVFLKQGVSLDEHWVKKKYEKAFVIQAGRVSVVLAKEITDEVVEAAIADDSVSTIVFLEDGFAGRDAVKANAHFSFKQKNKTMKTV
jgi:adenine-specific DNA-methyltransferase